ncbi:MAG TPA: FliH/SctL family protein [Ramlibacter sp.]|nr:FliH/SctL family protein [Ramlibacter sp.]
MRTSRNSAHAEPVLRDVQVHEIPHALLRPRRPLPPVRELERATAVSKPAAVSQAELAQLAPARTYEEGVADGYREGCAAGRAAQEAETEAWLKQLADSTRAKAVEEGRADGFRQGKEEAAQAIRQHAITLDERAAEASSMQRQRADEVVRGLQDQRTRLLEEAEDDLVAMGFEVVCRVLGAQAVEPAVIQGMVEHLLSSRAMTRVTARVHPDDHAWLAGQASIAGRASDWQWMADQKVQMGGVLIESDQGHLDARFEVQVDALRQALSRAREARRAMPPAATDGPGGIA